MISQLLILAQDTSLFAQATGLFAQTTDLLDQGAGVLAQAAGFLAQETGTPAAPGGPAGQPAPPSPAGSFIFLALLAGMMVFFLLSSRSQQKRQERQRQAMLDTLKKNDRVLTVGGVVGTVIQVKDYEVVLKVDESTNTKMTFAKSAVQRILGDEGLSS